MAAQFSTSNQLLWLLENQIEEDEVVTLRSLCLVNRQFNKVFSGKLRAYLTWQQNKALFFSSYTKREKFLESRTLEHFRGRALDNSASAVLSGKLSGLIHQKVGIHDENDPALTQHIRLVPNPPGFLEDDANVAAGCADPEVVAQLRLLQGLYISVNDDVQFAVGIDNVGIAVVLNGILGPSFGFPHYYLPQFRCLQELSLLELGGDLSAWRSSILGLLLANPQLQRLNLSINARTANWYTRETSPANKDVFSSFFAWICREFGDTNTQPLKLRALRLEDSIAIPDETILQRAFDMRVLEEIFVHDERDPWTTPWSILQAPIAPRLQRVYFKGLPDGEFWADFPGAMDGKDDRTLNFSRVGKTVCGAYAAASETPKHVFPRITFGRGRLSSDLEEFHQLRSADEVCSGLPKATHMAVNISIVTEIRESCDYDVSLPWPDLYYTLSFVPTLSSLWIINAADTGGERELPRLSFYEDKDRINIGVDERLAVWLAQGRPSIRYIKVGERAWRFEPVTAGKKWRIWEEVFDENESGESPPKPLNPGPWSFSVGYGRWNM